MIVDPFYYLSFSTTVVMTSLFNIQMMRSRGSRKRFSQSMLTGYLLLSLGFWPWMFLSDGYFLRPFFLVIAVCNVAIEVEAIRVFRALPAYAPPVSGSAGLPAGRPARSAPAPV